MYIQQNFIFSPGCIFKVLFNVYGEPFVKSKEVWEHSNIDYWFVHIILVTFITL